EEEGARGFDFGAGRVAHARLLRLGDAEHVLVLTVSALASDASSLRHLVAELADAYAALSEGAEAAREWAAREVLQYADYAEWQHDLLTSEEAKEGRTYWRTLRARGVPAEVQLPHETQTEAAPSGRPEVYEAVLDAESAERARLLSEQLGATVDALLLACWQTLLWRVTGQSGVIVFQSLDGRRFEEMNSAAGAFARWLPLEQHFAHGDTFADILHRAQQSQRDATTWQEYYDTQTTPQHEAETSTAGSDQSAAADLGLARAVGYEYEEAGPEPAPGGLNFRLLERRSLSEHSPLLLTASSGPDALRLGLRCDSSRFTPRGARRLLDALLALLDEAARSPHSPARLLPAVGRQERDELVRARNLTGASFEAGVCVHHLFERQAAHTPDATALVSEDVRLTYSELNERANRLARHLRSLGVGPESRVALCLGRSAEMVVALLSVLKAGGAYLPLDPAYPRERLSFMLADGGAEVLLTQSSLSASLPEHSAAVFLLDAQAEELSAYSAEDLATDVEASNLAYLIYTSGSTGRPKAVCVEHGQLVNYLRWAADAYLGEGGAGEPPAAEVPLHSPLGFDLTVTALYLPLLRGSALRLLGEGAGPEALAEALSGSPDYGLVKLTPAH
ncbi:MAG TPA: AMP-binding protein, partial [Pyrinomonadaceae bacterium]|nr:AMP-binding protein [Pyrinomonadaceae bacterium]